MQRAPVSADKRLKALANNKGLLAVALALLVLSATPGMHDMLSRFFQTGSIATVDSAGSEREFLKELERNVEAVKKSLSKILTGLGTGEEFSSELADLAASRVALQRIDVKVRQELGNDEGRLVTMGVSSEIVARHREFVRTYGQKFSLLMSGLAEIEDVRNDRGKLREKVVGLLEFVKTLQPQLRMTQLNLEKLPFRSEYRSARQTSSVLGRDAHALTFLASEGFVDLDVAETVEVKFTPEIRELAANLSYNPVKMYEYVRNNFDYEIYYGSLKGAQETLWEGAGNDFDLASLLIALYRVSGIPAKYVSGTVEIPIEQVMSWVGVINRSIAGDLFATGAVPSTLVIQNGVIKSLELEHVWVKAYVDYIPSRGAVNVAGDTWVHLDPSFKQYAYTLGVNITRDVPFDAVALWDRLNRTMTINPTENYVTSINSTVISGEIDDYNARVRAYLETVMPDGTVEQVLGGRTILKQEFGILPATLPYGVLTASAEYAQVPGELRHKLTFELQDLFGFTDIIHTIDLPDVAGKRITLSYLGATPSDEQLILSYQNTTVLPAYLISLKPILRIDGEIRVNGSSVAMGASQKMVLTFISPNESPDTNESTVLAGAYYSVELDFQRMPRKLMEELTRDFLTILAANTMTWKTDDVLGGILHGTAAAYFFEFDGFERIFNVLTLRKTSSAIVSADIQVSYSILGTPYEARWSGGFSIDVFRIVLSPFSRRGDGRLTLAFMRSAVSLASALEHLIFEQLWKQYHVHGISTVKALALASEQAIPIFRMTQENVGQILPELEVSQLVKDDIVNAIGAGKAVTIPRSELTLGNWTGTGYIIEDPETGDAAYRISGGLDGGRTVIILNWAGLTSAGWLLSKLPSVVGKALTPVLSLYSLNIDLINYNHAYEDKALYQHLLYFALMVSVTFLLAQWLALPLLSFLWWALFISLLWAALTSFLLI